MKAKEVIADLPVELQVSPTYIPPSLDEACCDMAGLWPERLSPQPRALPPMSEPPQLPEITLIGDSGTELRKLLLELMLWMAEGVIDLTGDRPNFTPPPNTKVTLPPGVEMPTNIHILGEFTTTYSM